MKILIRLLKERKLKKLAHLIYGQILSEIYKTLPHSGVKVVEENWDYLIILDACRYDTFKELNTISGELKKKISLASSTPEWVKKNFSGYYYGDIIYISSNPYISNVDSHGFRGTDHFFKVENVWHYGWDEELGTVPPRVITEAALQMKEMYPNKRMIVHYLQPHAPWIGETRLPFKELGLDPTAPHWVRGIIGTLVEEKGISSKFIKKAYKDNLKFVLREVKGLIEELEGKIIISADHGECFGEKWIFEHPAGMYVKELVEVPWLVIEKPKKLENIEKEEIKGIIRELKTKKFI